MTNVDPYVLNALSQICRNNPELSLDELPAVLAALNADSPAKRRFLTHIQQHRREVTFCWDTEQQAVCLRGIALKKGN
jgi:hypothetical protein